MRLLLVNPGNPCDSGVDQSGGEIRGLVYRFKARQKTYFAVPLALPTLAALTPKEHQLSIVDEMIEPIDFDAPYDLVGITAMTYKAPRAYEIAREFRNRGVPTILGGIHASMCPDEALEHVDSVAIGEADEIWGRILEDASLGRLERRYVAPRMPDVSKIPPPRFDLTSYGQYFSFLLQTTRGCPNGCEFCSVTAFNGHKLRRKPASQVIREVEELVRVSKTPMRLRPVAHRGGSRRLMAAALCFADDNFAIDRRHALSICAALKAYQDDHHIYINWFTSVNLKVAFDEELLGAMRVAGCFSLFIGFESLNSRTLESMKKRMNSPELYGDAIANIRRFGMEVYFSTILGGDFDTAEAGAELAQFVESHQPYYVWPNIVTPHPGTPLRRQMDVNGRMLSSDWKLYDQRNVVFKPAAMSPGQLKATYSDACCKIFDFEKMLERATAMLAAPRPLTLTLYWRIALLGWFIFALAVLTARSKVRPFQFVMILRLAPRFVIGNGTLGAIDSLVYALESYNFAESERARLHGSMPKDDSCTEAGGATESSGAPLGETAAEGL